MATDKHEVAPASPDSEAAKMILNAAHAAQGKALPSEASPITGDRLTRNELPALTAQGSIALPPEARPITRKWLTDDELPALNAPPGAALPTEASHISGKRLT